MFGRVTWSATGATIAVCLSISKSVAVLNSHNEIAYTISHGSGLSDVAFSPDGSLIAVMSHKQLQL
jgi:hypothetical protein